jgi:hypothetical protein
MKMRAASKNSASLKTLAAALNKSKKKRKGFSFLLNLRGHRSPITSVA